MRAVLRVEVEAVKFLKEEPHKLDIMMKRVRSLTDTLGNLRRYKQREEEIETGVSIANKTRLRFKKYFMTNDSSHVCVQPERYGLHLSFIL